MKIAFLNIYNGLVERGAEVFVSELAEELSSHHNVFVFQTGQNLGKNYKVKRIINIPFLPHQGNLIFAKIIGIFYEELYHLLVLLFTIKCIPYLWRERFDWIVPINSRWQVLILRLFRFLRGSKILISGQAGVGFYDKWNILIGKPDIFVALSPKAYSWAGSLYSEGKIVQIPNGVDIDKFTPGAGASKISLSEPIVLCVSALLPYKRIELLIQAASKLKSASLLIIGDGPLRKKIKKMGDRLLNDRFLLIPYVSHDEIVKYYNSAQLFSLPSRESEAFGIVYVEAMACNLPVVAPFDINRIEIIAQAGYLGNVEDIDNYASLLQKALQTDFQDKPRIQAEKFSWRQIAQKYEKVFREK